MYRWITGVFVALATSLLVSPARANLNVCNNTGQKIFVAVAWDNLGNWNSQGWFVLSPRQCTIAIPGGLASPAYWFYAESEGGLQWAGDGNAPYFCTTKNPFWLRNANRQEGACEGSRFRQWNTGGSPEVTIPFDETQMEPLQAANNCRGTIAQGRDAFIKCWMRNIATNKQKAILDCYDKMKSYSSFAICAMQDSLSDGEYKIANCADNYIRNRRGGEFLRCIGQGQINEEQARIFDCAVNNRGNYGAMGACALAGTLTPEQRRVYACVANNLNNYVNAGLCAAGNQLTPEQSRIANCVLSNQGNYTNMGVCAAVGNKLTPEQQAFVTCAISTGGQPYAFAACVGTQLTVNELQKCLTDGIGGRGCFGPNNTAVKTITNAWHDVTQGPGSGNEIVKGRELILGGDRGTIANTVRDPIRCLTFQRKC